VCGSREKPQVTYRKRDRLPMKAAAKAWPRFPRSPKTKGNAMEANLLRQVQQSFQFLTFLLDEQEYGLELFKIQEICGYAPITPIPNVPPHVRGVMNLRGTVLPVIDLRMKFRLPPGVYDKFTVIVIAMVGDKTVGLLVDAVSDVLQVPQDAMRAPPDFGSTVDTQFINGVFQTREHLAVALNLDKLLSEAELAPLTPAD
jgi:purine-binding chemotaxis protein CheW